MTMADQEEGDGEDEWKYSIDEVGEVGAVPGGGQDLVSGVQGGGDDRAAQTAGRSGDEEDLAHDVLRSN